MFLNERLDRYTLIEIEGRTISSVVAMFVYWLCESSTVSAVMIFMISQIIDLVRCAYRKHVLEPGIVAHHCMSIAICTAFLNAPVAVEPDVILATQKLLAMEFTNPFLHGSWMISKIHNLEHKRFIELCLLITVLIFWPYFRLYGSLRAVVLLAHHHGLATALASVLCGLQFFWFVKLSKRLAQMWPEDLKDL